jgi:cation transport ATPase
MHAGDLGQLALAMRLSSASVIGNALRLRSADIAEP